MNDHAELAQRFIDSFELAAENLDFFEHLEPVAAQLAIGSPDVCGQKRWKPISFSTKPTALDPQYAILPARFPPLYEQLVLNYRWADADLGTFTLLANPPGDGLNGLLARISQDPGLWEMLIPGGYIPFGKGPDMDYDPVCFDIQSRKNQDYRIVKIDHEEILCNRRVKVVGELAPSFRSLVIQTIERAERKRET